MLDVLSNLHIDLLHDGILFLIIFIATNLVRAIFRPLSWEAKILGQIFGKLLFLLVIFAAKRSKNADSYGYGTKKDKVKALKR